MVIDRRGMRKETPAPMKEAPPVRREVPENELTYTQTRSGGSGGQGVNTTDSTAIVTWRYLESTAFSDAEKTLIGEKLRARINKAGELSTRSSQERSLKQNKGVAKERLDELVQQALQVDAPRETAIPKDVKGKADAARLRDKNRAKRLKAQARGGFDD